MITVLDTVISGSTTCRSDITSRLASSSSELSACNKTANAYPSICGVCDPDLSPCNVFVPAKAPVAPTPTTKSPVHATARPATNAPIRVTSRPATKAPVRVTSHPATKAPVRVTSRPATKAPVRVTSRPVTKAPVPAVTDWPTYWGTCDPTYEPSYEPTQEPTRAPTRKPVRPPPLTIPLCASAVKWVCRCRGTLACKKQAIKNKCHPPLNSTLR